MPPPSETDRARLSPDRKVFAGNLKRFRLEKGLTRTQMAQLSGIAQSHYSQLESGSWEPRLATILALSKALGV